MPLYDFKCPSCGQLASIIRPMKEAGKPLTCPSCNNRMERVYAPVPSFNVKVEPHGFYPPERLNVRR